MSLPDTLRQLDEIDARQDEALARLADLEQATEQVLQAFTKVREGLTIAKESAIVRFPRRRGRNRAA